MRRLAVKDEGRAGEGREEREGGEAVFVERVRGQMAAGEMQR